MGEGGSGELRTWRHECCRNLNVHSVATSEMSVSLRVEQRIKESGKEVKTVTLAVLEYVHKSHCEHTVSLHNMI